MSKLIGSVSPFVFFSNHEWLVDAESATHRLTKIMTPVQIKTIEGEDRIDAKFAFGLMPNVHMWFSDIKQGFELRVTSVEDRQLIYFPGKGEVVAVTTNDRFVCNQTQGINIDTEKLSHVQIFPGRSGAGMAADRPALLQRLAALLDAPVQRRLQFATCFEANAGHQAAVSDMIRAVTGSALGAALAASPAIAAKLSGTILDLVLQSLPHNYSEDLLKPPKRIAPRHVKRAIDYIDSHARQSIAIDELADVCQVSIRSLQYGFRQFLNTSPADYIRGVRLEGARRSILDGEQTSLTDIASDWTFSNLSRFNTYFKAAYGETPAELLRRRRTKR